MSDIRTDYGLLINKDIKLHRTWFKQMTALHGINCKYRAPLKIKHMIFMLTLILATNRKF